MNWIKALPATDSNNGERTVVDAGERSILLIDHEGHDLRPGEPLPRTCACRSRGPPSRPRPKVSPSPAAGTTALLTCARATCGTGVPGPPPWARCSARCGGSGRWSSTRSRWRMGRSGCRCRTTDDRRQTTDDAPTQGTERRPGERLWACPLGQTACWGKPVVGRRSSVVHRRSLVGAA